MKRTWFPEHSNTVNEAGSAGSESSRLFAQDRYPSVAGSAGRLSSVALLQLNVIMEASAGRLSSVLDPQYKVCSVDGIAGRVVIRLLSQYKVTRELNPGIAVIWF